MALQQWALPHLRGLLPLDDDELERIVSYVSTLSDSEAAQNLETMLGDSPKALEFIASFLKHRAEQEPVYAAPPGPPPAASKTAGSAPAASKAASSAPAAGFVPAVGGGVSFARHYHTNEVIEAGRVRARDEVRSGSCRKGRGVAA